MYKDLSNSFTIQIKYNYIECAIYQSPNYEIRTQLHTGSPNKLMLNLMKIPVLNENKICVFINRRSLDLNELQASVG